MPPRTDRRALGASIKTHSLVLATVGLVFALATDLLVAAPRTLYWNASHIGRLRDSPESHTAPVRESLRQLAAFADAALEREPSTVIDKAIVPPSGDKHDYLSFSRYWWPNPDTADGLPYVRRDGHVNRKLLRQGDRLRIGQFYEDVESLALAAYLIDADKYAPHAMRQVRAWFIDPPTRMNPNVNFGQGVPGRSNGRGVGVMDTRHFIRVLDGIALLDDIGALSEADHRALKKWFSEYLDWLLTSDLGNEERRAKNNHGTWYAAQVAFIALYVGRPKVARDLIEEVRNTRIADSIEPDGRQPKELLRTRSMHYSLYNLAALSIVARLGEHVDIDLWSYEADTGASLARGVDFLVPYLREPSRWPYPKIDRLAVSHHESHVFYLASSRFRDRKYLDLLQTVRTNYEGRHFAPLLFPEYVAQTNTSTHRGRYTVTITRNFTPAPLAVELPDLSRYSQEAVRRSVPATSDGKVSVATASDIRLLDEAFRDDRGRDLARRQGTDSPQVIVIEEGVLTLEQVVDQLKDERFATLENGTATIRLPLLVAPKATLIVDGKRTPAVRLSTDRGAFLANAGRLFIVDALVTSWSEAKQEPTAMVDKTAFRPFITSYVRSETYLSGCTIQHLGFAAPSAYGVSLTSHPERNRGEPRDDWPTGVLVDNEFRGMYYGFYSFEARDVAIVGNRYVDSIVYGIDPHDRSTRLIIARNTATGTVEKHGIIGSRNVNNSFILENVSYNNTGSGIMLDRQCSHNVVMANKVYANGQGIAIYESPANIVRDNLIAFNKKSGVRVRNSLDINLRRNTIVGQRDYALEVYSKRLDDHQKRFDRGDTYDARVAVSFHGNQIGGNQGLAKARRFERLRLSDIRRDADLPAIAAQFGVDLTALPTGDDAAFGQELKPFTSELRSALAEPDTMVELKGLDE